MSASVRRVARQIRRLVEAQECRRPVIERVNASIERDGLRLIPVLDGLDPLRPLEARGKYVVHYELHDIATGRGKVGIVSKTLLSAISRMTYGKMGLAFDVRVRVT